jgi:cytochrome d ubiquinol oxidase subunit II
MFPENDMTYFGDPAIWLPLTFAALMGLSILIYVVLDGFDLGVGVLFPFAEPAEKDRMVASIGPFWDANETWLVLAIGILLVAFPAAHGQILTALYLPVAIMLIGLILRGVAFEFRAKAPPARKGLWNLSFYAGSLMTALSQGYMLGMYIMGLEQRPATWAFAALTAVFLTVGYSFIGAAWLILKTEGALQRKAVGWAKGGIWGLILGLGAVSLASPLVSPRIFDKWFAMPEALFLAPLPIISAALVALLWIALRRLPTSDDSFAWFPFAVSIALFALAFCGMAYSFYPYVVPEKLTIYEAASAPESLFIILIGTLFVLPMILGYTALSYRVFRGKATALSYE